jgi:tRNA (guanine37-N1)-methyltransferase
MEVLAGAQKFEVVHNEGSCSFIFDIRKVYWCSRLQYERDRILNKLKKNEVLCDAFCGVGPLAIRAARSGIKVIANDLNPDCYNYLKINASKNKIPSKMISSFNMDARDFISAVINRSKYHRDENELNLIPKDIKVHHFYMNLPKDALEFLDVFIGLFNNTKNEIYSKDSLPIVHVYGFSNSKDPKEDLYSRISNSFGIDKINEEYIVDFQNVRDVSNNKHMFCISVKIPPEVAYK